MTQRTQQPTPPLGPHQRAVTNALTRLARSNVMARIWDKDHTVWNDDPTEIADRLGWLTISRDMTEHVSDLRSFAEEVRNEGIRDVVLLGMGGSSLGPEVLRQCIGSAPGFPVLTVLDSTVPARIDTVTRSIDPTRSLVIVSSKSGGTIEPNSFYKHFRTVVESAIGVERAGKHFVAITDPGTSLEALGSSQGFRRVFENPPDLGGRYSVGSFFGLVPAALCGMDCGKLLDRVSQMAARCEAGAGVRNNPGGWLGAAIGGLTLQGRDKLTLVASPEVASFGLWVEQLIAESTGKDGKGIVPVVNEPLLETDAYSDDRLFVHVRLSGGDNAASDVGLERIRDAGHPVITLEMDDVYDVGAEFFRWEMATAVAGHLLGIHPFDQPNVQQAKDVTNQVLETYVNEGALPDAEEGSVTGLLGEETEGDYLSIMAYVEETDGVTNAVNMLRQYAMRKHRIATPLGYGPRFLHSTGQLHKGGPNTGLFLQMAADVRSDIPIPGERFGFGTLAAAQAIGDYEALKETGRRVVRINLGRDAEAAVLRLLGSL